MVLQNSRRPLAGTFSVTVFLFFFAKRGGRGRRCREGSSATQKGCYTTASWPGEGGGGRVEGCDVTQPRCIDGEM